MKMNDVIAVIKEDALYNQDTANCCVKVISLLRDFCNSFDIRSPEDVYQRDDIALWCPNLVCEMLEVFGNEWYTKK